MGFTGVLLTECTTYSGTSYCLYTLVVVDITGCEIDDLAQASDVGEVAIVCELDVLKVVEDEHAIGEVPLAASLSYQHEAGAATGCSKMFSEKSSARSGARSVARSTARTLVNEHD